MKTSAATALAYYEVCLINIRMREASETAFKSGQAHIKRRLQDHEMAIFFALVGTEDFRTSRLSLKPNQRRVEFALDVSCGPMNGYVALFIAILTEVIGTTALRACEGFSRLLPSVVVVIAYAITFFFFSRALRTVPIGTAYAIWAGVGIVLLVIVGRIFFRQSLDLPALIGVLLVLAGVLVIRLGSKTALL